jgi:BirA family biotin operon repressor/biotin-[acetyl-CoA-carboxylase] ligase
MGPHFRKQRFEEQRTALELHWVSGLSVLESTGSTNDDALAAARNGATHGSVFVAEEQTKGRGRRGSAWQSRAGDNLLVSVLLRPNLRPDQASGFALATGLAVRECVAPLLTQPALVKWPNDVLVAGKKLAGILVESQVQGNALSALVVGVGLNVSTKDFPEELRDRATSLALLGADITREEILAQLLAALGRRLQAYERTGIFGMREELAQYDALYGQRVRVDAIVGVARGIDFEGRLIIEDDNGTCHHVISGSVEIQAA